jgi:uncharacterized membrane protein YgaE (UPF0421/DUF939 family)
MLALYLADLLRLQNPYWTAISTLIVMQSTLGETLTLSGQRFVGTALGAVCGALLATYSGPSVIVFGVGIFAIGIICAVLRFGRAASALAGVTLSLVLLVARSEPPWKLAAHRFIEVSLGIAVGLLITVLWPERAPENRVVATAPEAHAKQDPSK